MDYTSTVTFESKIDPKVVYTLHKMSHARRVKINKLAAGAISKLVEIETEMVTIQADIDRAKAAAKIEPCTCQHELPPLDEDGNGDCHDKETGRCIIPGCDCREPKIDETLGGYAKMLELQGNHQAIRIEEIYPVYIQVCVAKIEGYKINGKPATTDSMIADGAEPMVGELGTEIQRVIRMTPEQVLGFKLPSTSGAQPDGQTTNTSAPTASA